MFGMVLEFGCTGSCEKVPAKFGEESSVKADGLCIGCLGQWAEVRRENSNMQEFFCTSLYIEFAPLGAENSNPARCNGRGR